MEEQKKLKLVALGDTEEVGSSCYAYVKETEGGEKEIIIVDMGINPTKIINSQQVSEILEGKRPLPQGLPDLTWLMKNRKYVKAVFFTHGHLDHIGAIKYYWDFFRDGIPIYASRYTADMIREELKDEKHFRDLCAGKPYTAEDVMAEVAKRVDIREFDTSKVGKVEIKAGGFTVKPCRVPHSIPESCAFLINTRDPFQHVFHLADFKFNGLSYNAKMVLTGSLELMGNHAIDWVVIESLYSNCEGFTPQENLVFEELFDLIMAQPDTSRVIVSHFASNAARMREMFRVAGFTGRPPALLGRAMKKNFRLAQKNGIIGDDVNPTFDEQNAGFLLVTGSQGEPRAVLAKAAKGKKRFNGKMALEILPTDVIFFSSDVIPGNEQDFTALIEDLSEKCALIFVDERSYLPKFEKMENVIPHCLLHVSGHGTWTDKRRALELLRPKTGVVPMHGDKDDEKAFIERVGEAFPTLKTMSCQDGTMTFE